MLPQYKYGPSLSLFLLMFPNAMDINMTVDTRPMPPEYEQIITPQGVYVVYHI